MPDDNAALELTFPEGLVGYPEWRRFRLEAGPDALPVAVLQSLDDESLFLLVTMPELVCSDYAYTLPSAARSLLGLEPEQGARALCTLVIRDEPFSITANLLGPIVYNPAKGLACQLVLADTSYSPQHLVTPAEGAGQESGDTWAADGGAAC